jgi:hypothetical protein
LTYLLTVKSSKIRSVVIDHLKLTYGNTSAIAYVYVEYKNPETQTFINIAANVLKQILVQMVDVPDDLLRLLVDVRSDAWDSLNLLKVANLIDKAARRFPTGLYLIVDAFDECESSSERGNLLKFLQALEVSNNNRIFITCRPNIQPPVQAKIIEIQAHDEDIETYVRAKLKNTRLDMKLRDEIIAKLLATAKGTFVSLNL